MSDSRVKASVSDGAICSAFIEREVAENHVEGVVEKLLNFLASFLFIFICYFISDGHILSPWHRQRVQLLLANKRCYHSIRFNFANATYESLYSS